MQPSTRLCLFLAAVSPALGQIVIAPVAVTTDPCTSTTVLPSVTVSSGGAGKYEQCYAVTYSTWSSDCFQPHTYTVTQTCDAAPCRAATETGIPPGFTEAAVVCTPAGNGTPVTETLVFPTESIEAIKTAGCALAGYAVGGVPQPTAGAGETGATGGTGGTGDLEGVERLEPAERAERQQAMGRREEQVAGRELGPRTLPWTIQWRPAGHVPGSAVRPLVHWGCWCWFSKMRTTPVVPGGRSRAFASNYTTYFFDEWICIAAPFTMPEKGRDLLLQMYRIWGRQSRNVKYQ
ncbi:hypothetical protein VTK73DRAFT_8765 [Phialemonium thermophilum]|uniref:Uncharacterized protein n=1 Tax=Phialemonium thermophilum TaxID=223376 RepID=A0ABR3W696_9PEZI